MKDKKIILLAILLIIIVIGIFKYSYEDRNIIYFINSIEKNNENIVVKDSEGYDLLLKAVNELDYNKVKYFVKCKGYRVNTTTNDGTTPLIESISIKTNNIIQEYNRRLIIKYLINNGADVNKQDYYGLTSLICAVRNNDFYALKILVARNADLNKKTSGNGTLFTNANTVKMAEYLLNNKLNINSVDENGRTILWHALNAGNMRLVKYLLKNGADIKVLIENKDYFLNELKDSNNKELDSFIRKYL